MMGVLKAQGRSVSRNKVETLYLSRFNDADCNELIQQMDDAGIEKSVLLLADFTFALPDGGLSVAEMLDRHVRVSRRHAGRLLVFAGIDPRWGADGIELFRRAAASGDIHGFKVYPPCGFTASDRRLYPFYEICAAHQLPVVLHVGATSGVLDFETARPIHLDQAARDFPGVNFILAHGSVHYSHECAMLCSHRPNVFLDVSGFEVAQLSGLRWVFEQGINHKILFGTDWPLFRLRGSQRDFVSTLGDRSVAFGAHTSDRDVELFFFGNAARLLPSAAAKR
jgi:predicted TIM-barrel fold metal-dependent hydrolase